MVGSLLIFAREGLEGTLICSILLTYLASAGRRDLFRYVFLGAGRGRRPGDRDRDRALDRQPRCVHRLDLAAWFETGVFAVAVAVLTYMTFWMRRHSRNMGRELRAKISGAVTGGSGIALGLVAFVTVGREAVETVIFLLAIAYQSSPLLLVIGAVIGLAIALAVSYAMFRVGLRLNLGRFFAIVGSLLMVVAAGTARRWRPEPPGARRAAGRLDDPVEHERHAARRHRDRRRAPRARRLQRCADRRSRRFSGWPSSPSGSRSSSARRGPRVAGPPSAPAAAV